MGGTHCIFLITCGKVPSTAQQACLEKGKVTPEFGGMTLSAENSEEENSHGQRAQCESR